MIVVTGGCGMIGSNVVKALNAAGHDDILVVDNLTNGHKFSNLADLDIADYLDRDEFLLRIGRDGARGVEAILHLGACSATTEWNGKLMMERNYAYSRELLHACLAARVPFVYASSAAVYGGSTTFREERAYERPLNVYGYSKKLFDDYVRRNALAPGMSPVIGLRYFNVYGPREQHKGEMASVAYHLYGQVRRGEPARLFGAHDGIAAGEQRRDFVYVEDVAAVNLWALGAQVSGIFNCGTGEATTFRDLGEAQIGAAGAGEIEYIPFPDKLRGRYQAETRADLTRLRAAGCDVAFRGVAAGVKDYVAWLDGHPG